MNMVNYHWKEKRYRIQPLQWKSPCHRLIGNVFLCVLVSQCIRIAHAGDVAMSFLLVHFAKIYIPPCVEGGIIVELVC